MKIGCRSIFDIWNKVLNLDVWLSDFNSLKLKLFSSSVNELRVCVELS